MVKRLSKKTPRKEIPHNSRIIPAGVASFIGKAILWTMLVSLIITNILTVQTYPPPPEYTNINALTRAQSADTHMQFAEVYWQNRQREDALREITIAKQLSQQQSREPENVLGATTPYDIIAMWEREPISLRAQFNFWQTVIAEHPDYRDAYVTLAALATRLNQGEDARYYQQKAETLDPNTTSTKTR